MKITVTVDGESVRYTFGLGTSLPRADKKRSCSHEAEKRTRRDLVSPSLQFLLRPPFTSIFRPALYTFLSASSLFQRLSNFSFSNLFFLFLFSAGFHSALGSRPSCRLDGRLSAHLGHAAVCLSGCTTAACKKLETNESREVKQKSRTAEM